VLVRGKEAVFVKAWGSGAVVRYDHLPNEPKVVPLDAVEPAPPSDDARGRGAAPGEEPGGAPR
jgi:hypothetical protein